MFLYTLFSLKLKPEFRVYIESSVLKRAKARAIQQWGRHMSNSSDCKTRPAHSAIKCVAIVIGLFVATGAIASMKTLATQTTPCDINVDAATYPGTLVLTVTY